MAKKDREQEGDETANLEEAMPEQAAPPAAAPTAGLVKIKKGDEILFVHPTTVKAHLAAGWEVV